MIQAPPTLLARAAACIRTPEAARALLRFLLAPLIARLERDLAAALHALEAMLADWKAGNLPPPPAPHAQPAPRPRAAPNPPTPRPAEPAWLTNLLALAAQDHAPQPRARHPQALRNQAPPPRAPQHRANRPRRAPPAPRQTPQTHVPPRTAPPRPSRPPAATPAATQFFSRPPATSAPSHAPNVPLSKRQPGYPNATCGTSRYG